MDVRRAIIALVLIGFMASLGVTLHHLFWLGAAAVLLGFLGGLGWVQRLRGRLGGGGLLCDTCKYNYPSACHRPERPNATRCPDYRR